MKIANYDFSPSMIPSLLTLGLLGILLSAGFWQLNRAADKSVEKQKRAANLTSSAKTVEIKPGMKDAEKLVGAVARLDGEFDANHQAALSQIKYKGQPGFYVLAPFKLAQSNVHILVLRGWTPETVSVNHLPTMPALTPGAIQLTGIVDRYPAIGIKLGEPDTGFKNWPKVLTSVNSKWLQDQLKVEFLPYVIRQTSADNAGLTRDWHAFPVASESMPPERHYGYAFMWFSMALALIVIYIVANTRSLKSSNAT